MYKILLKILKSIHILSACQIAIKPTSARLLGPAFCYKKGDCCLNVLSLTSILSIHLWTLPYMYKQLICIWAIPYRYHGKLLLLPYAYECPYVYQYL